MSASDIPTETLVGVGTLPLTAKPGRRSWRRTAAQAACVPLHPQALRRKAVLRRSRLTLSRRELALKRAFDVTLVLLFALPAGLVILACMLAIRLESPGAPMFTQLRTGKNGKRFRLWKLRTMVYNAEELKVQLQHLNELQWPDFKITHDPRITKVGAWLRKTSLDELPQLWNVLRGDMSLVGPRPTSFSSSTYSLWHTERLELTPGLTGLWQVLARGECEFDERLRLDSAYLRAYSFSLDLRILLATTLVMLAGRGGK